MAFCSDCGSKLPEQAKFCPSCGAGIVSTQADRAISSTIPPEPAQPRAKDTGTNGPFEPGDYIGLGRRFVAHIVDSIIVLTFFYIIGMQIAGSTGGTTEDGFDLEGAPALITIALTFSLAVIYYMLTEGRGGQSLGKWMTRIKVVSIDGQPCTMRQAFVRNVLRIIDGLFFYLVGIILILMSNKKQRLGDRIAETVVIRKIRRKDNAHGGAYVYRSNDRSGIDSAKDGKARIRPSWGIRKGKDAWDI